MSVGLQPSKVQLDNSLGAIFIDLENLWDRALKIRDWWIAKTDAELQGSPWSYTSGEVAVAKSALNTLNDLIAIYRGGTTLKTADQTSAFAKQVKGIGI